MSTVESIKKKLEQDWFDFLKRNSKKLSTNVIDGASPPSVFVGHKGYPKVRVGPMVPPIHGNTSILDNPEGWTGKSLEEIVNYRMNLIRGILRSDVNDLSNKYIESLQEISMSMNPVESSVTFDKYPLISSNIFSPSKDMTIPSMLTVPVTKFLSYQVKADRRIERVYDDSDMKSTDAMLDLYHRGISISQISKLLSMGMVGRKKSRRLVPTRWGISATDQSISDRLIAEIKHFSGVDSYMVFAYFHLANRYSVILVPSSEWSFEMAESWFDTNGNIAQASDYEGSKGLRHYPKIAGAYFAGRLAAVEYLHRVRRLAAVLILREILPEYVYPLGVWQVREGIRMAMKGRPENFSDFGSSLRFVTIGSSVSIREWVRISRLFHEMNSQKRISDWIKPEY